MVNLCQLNVSGLSPQSAIAVDRLCYSRRISILALQEVGTSPAVNTFTNMKTFGVSADRGVSLSINPDLKPQRIHKLESALVGAVFATIQIDKKPLMVGSVYRSPSNSLSPLLDVIRNAWALCKSSGISSLLVLGDLNARCIPLGDRQTNKEGKELLEFCDTEKCVALSPGRNTFLCNNGGSVIDIGLMFGNAGIQQHPWVDEESAYTLFTGFPSRGHAPVFTEMNVQNSRSSKREVPDLARTDWKLWSLEVESVLCEHPPSVTESPESMLCNFLNCLKSSNETHIPTKTICKHSRPFWTPELSELSVKLRDAQKKLRYRRTNINKEAVEQAKTIFKEALIKKKNEWIHQRLDGLNVQECSEFWDQYRRMFLAKEENTIGCLENQQGELLHIDSEKDIILFDTYFTGKHLQGEDFDDVHLDGITEDYTRLKNEIEDDDHHDPEDQLNRPVTTDEVSAAISSMKASGKAWDGDGIHPTMLKHLRHRTVQYLADMFSRCLKLGRWLWNSSYVTFIQKPGKSSYVKPGSFRPITISSYIGKMLERVMDRRIKDLCAMESIPDEEQEGFLPVRNTTRYLFKLLSTVHETRRRKLTAFLLCIDFQKAFDSVPHECLIVKLHKLGINGMMLNLIDNMLSQRSVRLKINGVLGPLRRCGRVGLPQGAVLSPILFILYISDLLCTKNLPEEVRCRTEAFKFADDGSVLVFGDQSQCERTMAVVLDYIHNWCRKWRLAVNCDRNKTEIIIIRPRGSSDDGASPQQLKLGNKAVSFAKNSKVLGVYIDSNLNFMTHAADVLKRCWFNWNKLTSMTGRLSGINSSGLSLLFRTVILTKILYAAPIWLKQRTDFFGDLVSRARLKITGGQVHIAKPLSELLACVPPIDVLVETVATKFVLKGLAAKDNITAKLLQIEAEQNHVFFWQIAATKRYLVWKSNQLDGVQIQGSNRDSIRAINLGSLEPDTFLYSKEEMRQYTCNLWDRSLKSSINHLTRDDPFSILPLRSQEELASIINSEAFLDFPIVPRNMSRQNSSQVLDFVHGRSLRFQDFSFSYLRYERSLTVPNCLECGQLPDSAFHKLFECTAVRDVEGLRDELRDISSYEMNFHLPLIFSQDKQLKSNFRKLVRAVVEQSMFGDELLV